MQAILHSLVGRSRPFAHAPGRCLNEDYVTTHAALVDIDVVFHEAAFGGYMPEMAKYVLVNMQPTSRCLHHLRHNITAPNSTRWHGKTFVVLVQRAAARADKDIDVLREAPLLGHGFYR
jgi:hypothetical protein